MLPLASRIARAALVCLLGLSPACFNPAGEPGPDDQPRPRLLDANVPDGPAVRIGIPDEVTGLQYSPLHDGDDVALESFGQGGTHVILAIRCVGFGDAAFVDVTLTNQKTGDEITTPVQTRPSLLLCLSDEVCDLVPLFVMTGGLADPDDKDGLAIEIAATVRNQAGVEASTSVQAIMRRQ